MGTSAVIRVSDLDLELYKHFDGYPEATLEWLLDFNDDFSRNIGHDPEFKMAQLVRSSALDAKKYNLDDSRYTGWGLSIKDEFHGNYRYKLLDDGGVMVNGGIPQYKKGSKGDLKQSEERKLASFLEELFKEQPSVMKGKDYYAAKVHDSEYTKYIVSNDNESWFIKDVDGVYMKEEIKG